MEVWDDQEFKAGMIRLFNKIIKSFKNIIKGIDSFFTIKSKVSHNVVIKPRRIVKAPSISYNNVNGIKVKFLSGSVYRQKEIQSIIIKLQSTWKERVKFWYGGDFANYANCLDNKLVNISIKKLPDNIAGYFRIITTNTEHKRTLRDAGIDFGGTIVSIDTNAHSSWGVILNYRPKTEKIYIISRTQLFIDINHNLDDIRETIIHEFAHLIEQVITNKVEDYNGHGYNFNRIHKLLNDDDLTNS